MKKDYFHVSEVEPQELMQVLLEHFSFLQHSELVYKFQNAQQFIEVACDETGNIKSITPSTDFPPDELCEIDKKIQDTLLTKHGTKICQIIGFCGLPITGYFRYKDWFQMLPVPEDAPKPKVLLADHPFILEVPYETCPSLMIDASRKQKKQSFTRDCSTYYQISSFRLVHYLGMPGSSSIQRICQA